MINFEKYWYLRLFLVAFTVSACFLCEASSVEHLAEKSVSSPDGMTVLTLTQEKLETNVFDKAKGDFRKRHFIILKKKEYDQNHALKSEEIVWWGVEVDYGSVNWDKKKYRFAYDILLSTDQSTNEQSVWIVRASQGQYFLQVYKAGLDAIAKPMPILANGSEPTEIFEEYGFLNPGSQGNRERQGMPIFSEAEEVGEDRDFTDRYLGVDKILTYENGSRINVVMVRDPNARSGKKYRMDEVVSFDRVSGKWELLSRFWKDGEPSVMKKADTVPLSVSNESLPAELMEVSRDEGFRSLAPEPNGSQYFDPEEPLRSDVDRRYNLRYLLWGSAILNVIALAAFFVLKLRR